MSYIEVNGITTWYSEQGAGEPLILLHGGMVGSFSWGSSGIVESLAEHFRVFSFDRRARGLTHDPGGPITYDAMTDDTIRFVEAIGCGPAHFVGYSDGANIIMLLALRRPDLVRQIALLSGNFHYSGLMADAFDSAALAAFVAGWYDANSPSGAGHAQDLAARLGPELVRAPTLSEADLAKITARTLIMAADDDLIPIEHFVAQYRAIEHSELAVVPGTSHGFVAEKSAITRSLLIEFLTKGPQPTFFGVRRAAH